MPLLLQLCPVLVDAVLYCQHVFSFLQRISPIVSDLAKFHSLFVYVLSIMFVFPHMILLSILASLSFVVAPNVPRPSPMTISRSFPSVQHESLTNSSLSVGEYQALGRRTPSSAAVDCLTACIKAGIVADDHCNGDVACRCQLNRVRTRNLVAACAERIPACPRFTSLAFESFCPAAAGPPPPPSVSKAPSPPPAPSTPKPPPPPPSTTKPPPPPAPSTTPPPAHKPKTTERGTGKSIDCEKQYEMGVATCIKGLMSDVWGPGR